MTNFTITEDFAISEIEFDRHFIYKAMWWLTTRKSGISAVHMSFGSTVANPDQSVKNLCESCRRLSNLATSRTKIFKR